VIELPGLTSCPLVHGTRLVSGVEVILLMPPPSLGKIWYTLKMENEPRSIRDDTLTLSYPTPSLTHIY